MVLLPKLVENIVRWYLEIPAIYKFKGIKKMEQHSAVLIIGDTGSGKTFLVKDLLYHNHSLMCNVMFSPHGYEHDYLDASFIHNSYNYMSDWIMFRQRPSSLKFVPSAFKELTVTVDLGHIPTDPKFEKLLSNHRSYCTQIIMTQSPSDPDLVEERHLRYCFIFPPSDEESLQNVYVHYFTDKLEYPHFKAMIARYVNESFTCLVVDYVKERIYYYKANPHPGFKITKATFEEVYKKTGKKI